MLALFRRSFSVLRQAIMLATPAQALWHGASRKERRKHNRLSEATRTDVVQRKTSSIS